MKVFCAAFQHKVYGSFFFEGNVVTESRDSKMLQNWLPLFTLRQEDLNDFII